MPNYTVPDWDRDQLDLISRWYNLRKQGKLYPLIQIGNTLYKFDPINRWDGREHLDWNQLAQDVVAAEIERKGPGKETSNGRRDSGYDAGNGGNGGTHSSLARKYR